MKQIVSNPSTNSYGLKIKTEGISLKRFAKNPVMLYQHDPKMLIGTWEDVKIEDGNLVATPNFDASAEKYKGLYERNVLRGASIGIGLKVADIKDGVLTKSELYEISLVSIPSNENCLKLYKDEQPLNEADVKLMLSGAKNENKNKNKFMINYFNWFKGKLDLKSDAPDDEVKQATEKLLQNDLELQDFKLENEKLKADVAELTEKLKMLEGQEKANLLNNALKDGLITEDMLTGFEAMETDALKVLLQKLEKPSVKDFVDEGETADLSLNTLDTGELLRMAKENPELYKKLTLNKK